MKEDFSVQRIAVNERFTTVLSGGHPFPVLFQIQVARRQLKMLV